LGLGTLKSPISNLSLRIGDATMWQTYFQPTTLDETLALLAEHAGRARVVAGGTDVLVELQRGVKPTDTLIDITALRELRYVRHDGSRLNIGGLATHNDVIASEACVRYALPLAQACWEVGAPQIRTRATIAGNLITASPANDTITPLLALDAEVVLVSKTGERVVPLHEFYPGFRKTVIRPDELLREIRVPALNNNQRGLFIKLGLRRAQAISVIDIAIVLTFADIPPADQSAIYNLQSAIVKDVRITLGCLAPTIVRAPSAEAYLRGKQLDSNVCAEAGRLACSDVAPIDDVRGSAAYRLATLANLVENGLQCIAESREREGWPEKPVLLETLEEPRAKNQEPGGSQPTLYGGSSVSAPVLRPISAIITTINGQRYTLENAHTLSLLDALRESAGLTGTKEGCAEGECGACTVWLNGQAIMSCLTPAPQAHGAEITTIEGLAAQTMNDERRTMKNQSDQVGGQIAIQAEAGIDSPFVVRRSSLHPLQQAFIANAAVQCGYCIPGMLMAGAKLLDEHSHPDLDQIQVALSGNICRCTGYRKILDAVLAAAGSHKD
jgi:xanthine dehydrogenase iron-sulfur cluster and FAD-binding subunit A